MRTIRKDTTGTTKRLPQEQKAGMRWGAIIRSGVQGTRSQCGQKYTPLAHCAVVMAEGRCLTAGPNRSLNKMRQPGYKLAGFMSGRCQGTDGVFPGPFRGDGSRTPVPLTIFRKEISFAGNFVGFILGFASGSKWGPRSQRGAPRCGQASPKNLNLCSKPGNKRFWAFTNVSREEEPRSMSETTLWARLKQSRIVQVVLV